MNPPGAPVHFPPLPKGTAPLWFGVLGAPAAWGVQLQSIYALTHSACLHDRRSLLHSVTAVLFAVAMICTVVSIFYRAGDEQFPDQRERVHFLASLGAFSGALFALVILAQAIAIVMLDPCAT